MALKATQSPLVTIAIPLYNQQDYIKQTLSSLINQTYSHFEIFIYDDCSTDDSCKIVNEFKDKRIKLIKSEKRLGPEGNWNRCLTRINGEYYLLLPGDDILYPDYIVKKLAIMKEDLNESIAFVGCSRWIINAMGKPIFCRHFPGNTGIYTSQDVLRRTFIFGTNVIGEPAAVLLRSSVAKKLAFYRASPGYLIDLDFWIRALQFGGFFYLREPLCGFRVSSTSWSAQIGLRQRAEFIKFIKKIVAEGRCKPNLWQWVSVYMSSWVSFIGRMLFFIMARLKLNRAATLFH